MTITIVRPDGKEFRLRVRPGECIGDTLRRHYRKEWRPTYYPKGETWGVLVLDPPGESLIRYDVIGDK